MGLSETYKRWDSLRLSYFAFSHLECQILTLPWIPLVPTLFFIPVVFPPSQFFSASYPCSHRSLLMTITTTKATTQLQKLQHNYKSAMTETQPQRKWASADVDNETGVTGCGQVSRVVRTQRSSCLVCLRCYSKSKNSVLLWSCFHCVTVLVVLSLLHLFNGFCVCGLC